LKDWHARVKFILGTISIAGQGRGNFLSFARIADILLQNKLFKSAT